MRLINAEAIDVNDTIGGQNDFADCIREAVQTVLDNTCTATPEEIINCAEESLSNLAASLEKEHAHIVDEKGVEYSAGMIRSIVEVLKAVRTARRVPDGC